MKKSPYFPLGKLFVLLLMLPSCLSDIEIRGDDEWQPQVGIPVVNSSFQLRELLTDIETDGLLMATADGLLQIVYTDQVPIDPKVTLPEIPDLPLPISEPEQQLLNPSPSPFRVDLMTLKNGELTYTIANPFAEKIILRLTLFNLLENNVPLELTDTLPAATGGIPATISGQMDLTGYTVNFQDDFRTSYQANLFTSGDQVTLPPFLLTIQSIDYQSIQGYFGQFPITIPVDSIGFELLEDWENGEIAFADPEIRLNFRHNLGVPIRLQAPTFLFHTHRAGIIPLDHAGLRDGILLNYPPVAETGMDAATLIRLGSDNSNLATILSEVPFQLNYAFFAVANPDEDDTQVNHFTDSVRMEADLEVVLPLDFSLREYQFSEKADLSFDDDLEEAVSAEFKLVVDNGFPFDLNTQVYFLDENEMIFDSLFVEGTAPILRSAQLDATGIVAQPMETITIGELTEEKLSAMRGQLEAVNVVTTLSTTAGGSEFVKVFEDYEMTIKLGLLVNL